MDKPFLLNLIQKSMVLFSVSHVQRQWQKWWLPLSFKFFATDIWCSFFPIWSLPKIWDEMTPNYWNWKELFFRNFSLFSFYGMFRYGEIGVKSSRYCFCYAYHSRCLMPPCIFWNLTVIWTELWLVYFYPGLVWHVSILLGAWLCTSCNFCFT